MHGVMKPNIADHKNLQCTLEVCTVVLRVLHRINGIKTVPGTIATPAYLLAHTSTLLIANVDSTKWLP